MDSRKKLVRADSRFLARHELEGLVGDSPPIQMEGGTTFYFVTNGIHEALDRARDAANGLDVRIGGGPTTIQQYLRMGLIDELRARGYKCVQFVASEKATHVVLRREVRTNAE